MGQVGRRQFLIATGGVLTAPLFARAQPRRDGRPFRIGVLFGAGGESMHRYLSAFSERLAGLGYVQGQNLHIDVSPVGGGFADAQTARDVVRTFLAKHPDAFFTCLTSIAVAAAQVTQTVPIVFAWVPDPVAVGLVKSLAHPGGNITGVTNRFAELLLKRLELARELVPELKRVAFIGYGRMDAMYEPSVQPLRRAAAQFGIEVLEFVERPWVELYQQAVDEGAGAVIPVGVFVPYGDRLSGELVIESAQKRHVPVIFAGVEMVEAGGLISYGTNIIDDLRRGADLLAKVFRGVKPSDIPVDQAARFELAVNLKTAKASGITIPRSILLRADRVIE